jgi:Cupin-like domain
MTHPREGFNFNAIQNPDLNVMLRTQFSSNGISREMITIIPSDSEGSDASVDIDETVDTTKIAGKQRDLTSTANNYVGTNRNIGSRLLDSNGNNIVGKSTNDEIQTTNNALQTQQYQQKFSSTNPSGGARCEESFKTSKTLPNYLVWERPGIVHREKPMQQYKKARESIVVDLTDDQSDEGDCSVEKDEWIDWSDQSQVQYDEIERISVHDIDATKRVTELRRNGVPVVLTNHVGWAQFAQRWLLPFGENSEESTSIAEKLHSNSALNAKSVVCKNAESMLDLSKPHKLNYKKIIEDIGSENVPVLPRKYDEYNPTRIKMPVEEFLFQAWPDMEMERRQQLNMNQTKCFQWYMHQWQFPLSGNPDVVSMLCGNGKNNPLPNNILGDDLLSYWLDKEKCNCDSPYQYLFMGRENTKSKLHCDAGGLVITIAPIIGTKEVVLVHRDDGSKLYKTEADIDNVNLDSYPMLYDIRAWKSVIKPGEILIMPEGTFHQCRNVTPCFSYHRFYLDTVNLSSFLNSYYMNDAKEISHDEVIWNAAHALMRRIDNYVEYVDVTSAYSIATTTIPEKIKGTVHNLRILRNVSCEILVRVRAKISSRGQTPTIIRDYKHWNGLVFDIDETLHTFRYRYDKNPPSFAQKSSWREPVSKKRRHVEE